MIVLSRFQACHRPLRAFSMPLKAKILSPRAMSTKIGPLPGDPEDDVLFTSKYGVRTIELNRPEKLNSLNASMARKIVLRLQEWRNSQMANVIVMKGAGRAFCAGGDVAALANLCKEGPEGQQKARDYFALEYKLDHLIATYDKPYVAFMDGITMGGGVGLSVNAPIRIATERTVFAMPETTIGFFPDVGASFFLPRMEGQLGTYLALTSERLKGPEVFFHGVATHYLHSSSLPDLEARLAELQFRDTQDMFAKLKVVDATIEEFVSGLPHDLPLQLDTNLRKFIDYVFHPDYDIEAIFNRLQEVETRPNVPQWLKEWATKTTATIRERSPTSVAVTLKQLQKGREWNIFQTFQHEHHIASKFMSHPDFVTGVSARLIDKKPGRPDWKPATLQEVTSVDDFFSTDPRGLELLQTDPKLQYSEIEYPWLGLPTEADVKDVLDFDKEQSKELVLEHFRMKTHGKMGVREKVTEILDRLASEEGAFMSMPDREY